MAVEWLKSWHTDLALVLAVVFTLGALNAAFARRVWEPIKWRRDWALMGMSLIWMGDALAPGKPGPVPERVGLGVAAGMLWLAHTVSWARRRLATRGTVHD